MSPALQRLQRDTGLNPAWLWVEQGRELWQGASAGPSCASCHGPIEGMRRAAATHPRWHVGLGRPVTLMDQVRECSTKRQGTTDGDVQRILSLTAALVAAADGVRIEPDPHPSMQPWATQGQALWHQRMGQLNLSCAQCHDQRAGQRLGGTRIPQGHDTGYPLYRMEWQTLGTLQRRLRGCMTGIRAEPFAPDADEWLALMVYMQRRSAGLAVEAGAVRP